MKKNCSRSTHKTVLLEVLGAQVLPGQLCLVHCEGRLLWLHPSPCQCEHVEVQKQACWL